MIKTELCKNLMVLGLILQVMLLIIQNKVDRKFDYLINILGADHAGYIKRISSSVEALSATKNKLICKVSQLSKINKR